MQVEEHQQPALLNNQQLENPQAKKPLSARQRLRRRWWTIIIIAGVLTAALALLGLKASFAQQLVTMVSTVLAVVSFVLAMQAMNESREQLEELQQQSGVLRTQSIKSEEQLAALQAQSVESRNQLGALHAQSAESKEQLEELRSQSIDRMDKMHALISTKYVASFPADMDCLIELLRSAEREISILVDVAGYGHMSRHGSFKQYEQLLISKREKDKVEIHIALYDMDSWSRITPRLFRPPNKGSDPSSNEHCDYVSELKNSKELEDYWSDLDRRLDVNGGHPSSRHDINTHEEFIDQLRRDEIHYRQTIPGIEVQLSTPNHLPMLCWMVDNSRAVYSFIFDRSNEGIHESKSKLPSLPSSITSTDVYQRYQDTAYEITFTTSDPVLIEVLKDVMWSYAPSLIINQKARRFPSDEFSSQQKEQK